MTKEDKIEKFLKELVKVGEYVYVRGLSSRRPTEFCDSHVVDGVNADGSIEIIHYHTSKETTTVRVEDFKKSTRHIGANPFPEKPWNSRLRIISFQLSSILFSCGYERRINKIKSEKFGEVEVSELNWNPTIVDKEGNEVSYQRDFCWSLKDKQLLIESIYNNIDIGKIVLRKRSYEWVQERVSQNKIAHFKDIVDGKQRLNALLGFITDEFKDLGGNYYSDLSKKAQSEFENFQSIAFGEIGEAATDEDVKAIFLGVNFTGVPMSKDHIDFVKNINL